MVASAKGGMDIEAVAKDDPDAIIKEGIDIRTGVVNRLIRVLCCAPVSCVAYIRHILPLLSVSRWCLFCMSMHQFTEAKKKT